MISFHLECTLVFRGLSPTCFQRDLFIVKLYLFSRLVRVRYCCVVQFYGMPTDLN